LTLIRQLILLAVFVGLSGCSQPTEPLRVGSNAWPGYLGLYYARDLGYLNPERVRLIDFDNTGDTLRALRNHDIDAAAITLDEVLQLADHGQQPQIILVFDISNGADTVLAKPGITRLAQLRGKRIGVQTNALGAYMLARLLARAGLTPEDVVIINLPTEALGRAYRQNEIDVAITYEPFRSELLTEGAREIFSSRDIPGEIVDVLVVNKRTRIEKSHELEHLVDSYFKALAVIRRNPETAAEHLKARTGTSTNEVLSAWKLMELPDRTKNSQLMEESRNGLTATAQRLEQVMLTNGLLRQKVEIAPMIYPQLIRDTEK
jgi:NitT/TauT family transport system substrate-binding protein